MDGIPPGLDIAVIGSGIAGLSAAWLLSRRHRVTLYEAEGRIGGHSNTVQVGGIGIDTGFIVYNEKTYPNLTALFRHLGVETDASDMSFSVSKDDGGFEYAGGDLAGLLAQPGNLLKRRFWSMLRDLRRFYAEAPGDIALAEQQGLSLAAYLDLRGYGRAFREDHLLPMASAIWSTPCTEIGRYPAAAFLRFCQNHALLQVTGRPVWRTVAGGSRHYVARLRAGLSGPVFTARPIRAIRRSAAGVLLRDDTGASLRHDEVVIAAHAHQALALLEDADAEERALLGAFGTTENLAVLHQDASLMPRRRRAWSAWNFVEQSAESEDGQAPQGPTAPFLTYWMNKLQKLSTEAPYFVTINPPRAPAPGTVIRRETYNHPLFDQQSAAAQKRLWALQGRRRAWFCGAWFGAGFHEDGLQAGLAVAEALGGLRRPWSVPEESGRIWLPADRARGAAAAMAGGG